MKVKDILSNNSFELISNELGLDNEVKSIFSSDLLSHVMGNAGEGCVLITVLKNINVLGVASLLDMSCVVFSHGVKVNNQIINKSNELGIPLLRTKLTTVSTILILDKLG